jgi:hypothetical protein
MKENFGLINRGYDTDREGDERLTQWQRFEKYVIHLSNTSPTGTSYKVVYIGRHGEGYRKSHILDMPLSVYTVAHADKDRQRGRSKVRYQSLG